MAERSERSAGDAFEFMISRAFPDLPEAELVALRSAWKHVERWAARLPRALPFEDEPAHVFAPPEQRR